MRFGFGRRWSRCARPSGPHGCDHHPSQLCQENTQVRQLEVPAVGLSPKTGFSYRPCGARVITSWAMGSEAGCRWNRGSWQTSLGMSATCLHCLVFNPKLLIFCNIEASLVGMDAEVNLG